MNISKQYKKLSAFIMSIMTVEMRAELRAKGGFTLAVEAMAFVGLFAIVYVLFYMLAQIV